MVVNCCVFSVIGLIPYLLTIMAHFFFSETGSLKVSVLRITTYGT